MDTIMKHILTLLAFAWTSTPYASLARYRELKFNSNSLHSSYSDRGNGYSVRCMQD
jgi:hypothetical protein